MRELKVLMYICLTHSFFMIKDIVQALELGFKIISVFLLSVLIGYVLDGYFNTRPVIMLIMLLLAFIENIRILLGLGKHE